jgi:hypothetical protein
MPSYQLRIYSTAGQLLHVTDRFRSATVEHRVNTPSMLTLVDYELTPVAQYLQANLDAIIELRRSAGEFGVAWYTEYVGLHRTNQIDWSAQDSRTFTSHSRGLLDLIRRRSIRYFSDIDCGLPDPTPADDVIKQLVRANAGSLATVVNGRTTNGVTAGLTIAASTGAGPDFQGNFQGKNLLESITTVGPPNKVDFSVEWGGPSAANTFVFQTYFPFKGTDRRASQPPPAPMVFSPGRGNMANPSYTKSRTDEITSAVVYGALGDATIAVAAAATDSPWNTTEQDKDARGEDRAQALTNLATQMLFDKRAAINLKFDVIQTPSSAYGRDYVVGDVVTGSFSTVQADVKIRAATLTAEAGRGESLALEIEEYIP